jgi:hypothetical protein
MYLRGRHAWNKRTAEGLQKATAAFEQAIERDPAYALAHAGLADSYALQSLYSGSPTQESFPRARAAAERGLRSTRSWPRPTPRWASSATASTGTTSRPSASSRGPSRSTAATPPRTSGMA